MKQASSKSDQKKSACPNVEFFNLLEIITTNVQVNVYEHRTSHGSSILTESQTPNSIPQCLEDAEQEEGRLTGGVNE
ncbi:unnamed protein product [Urochloa humidicola]